MAYSKHELNILRHIKKFVSPKLPKIPCPKFQLGPGWWDFHAYKKEDYPSLFKIRLFQLESLYDVAIGKIPIDRHVVNHPYENKTEGEEDDFMWTEVLVRGTKVLISVKRRSDGWYDFCLTVFAQWNDTDGPDIS